MALVKDVQVCQKNQFEDMMYEIEKLERGTNSFVEFAVGTEQESYGCMVNPDSIFSHKDCYV